MKAILSRNHLGMLYTTFSWVILVFGSSSSWAITLPTEQTPYAINLSEQMEVLLDPDRAWDVQDVLKRTFEPPHAGPYKLRQSNSAIWLRFQLTNPTEVSQTLILNSSAVFNVEFQLFKVVGDKAEPSGKEFKFHRPAIRMIIPPGTSNYVVKLVNWNNFYELNLHTTELLWKEGVLSLVTLGLAIGILLVTVYLSSGMWIGLRQTTLSYYLIYIHTLMVTIFANSGLIRYFFEGPALTWGTYNLSGFMGCCRYHVPC